MRVLGDITHSRADGTQIGHDVGTGYKAGSDKGRRQNAAAGGGLGDRLERTPSVCR